MEQPTGQDRETSAPEVCVVVVSYDTADLTCAALASLEAGTAVPHELVVVDNASGDGSAERIRREFPRARLLALDRNLGFARANNLAAGLSSAPYLLLLNPDTLVPPGAVEALLDFARRRPGAGIWGGRTVHADGRLNPTSLWRRATPWSLFCNGFGLAALWPRSALANPEACPRFARDHEREVDIVTGCFLLIERGLWDRLGGFDPAFFVYGEEADLCLRARALGARPAFTPAATIVHLTGASQPNEPRQMQLLAARIRLARRHLPARQRRLAVAIIRGGVAFKAAVARVAPSLARRSATLSASRAAWSDRARWWDGY
ncbi:glycosyltransferase family 2 protein [Rubellimicrobium aerolatum]|uniref:Glycosyltransferase family 2 protein n=1 Tax=Rubellimicrobium aerolatum TaxID=490979 RepID=A0ABW0SHL2_9RHOB|nr:glycosyltransferase family 2 protein [Rubellimicrobium aerolatum]MBP1807494.1 GT2 family glycosyltransferase [Rubellimicrobium aerolatum]